MTITKPSPGGNHSLLLLGFIAAVAVSLWCATGWFKAPLRMGTPRSRLCLGIRFALEACAFPLSKIAYPNQGLPLRDLSDVLAWSIILPLNALLWGYGSAWLAGRFLKTEDKA